MNSPPPIPPAKPVSTILHEITDGEAWRTHDLAGYAAAFAYSELLATSVLRVGRDCVALALANGLVLKVTIFHLLVGDMGRRPFDLPVVKSGRIPSREDGREVMYLIQPKVESLVTDEACRVFYERLSNLGYRLVNPQPENLGIYRGKLLLLDPWVACWPRPVSEVLREITDPSVLDSHDLEEYALAFEGHPFRATRHIWSGTDCVALELTDGKVLKITNKMRIVGDMGRRPFDLPTLQTGSLPNPRGHDVLFFVQPFAQTPVSDEQTIAFMGHVREFGYRFVDPNRRNLGMYRGKVVLLDLWAVQR